MKPVMDPCTVTIQFPKPEDMPEEIQSIVVYLSKVKWTFEPNKWVTLEFPDAEKADAFRDGYCKGRDGYCPSKNPRTHAYYYSLWMTAGPEERALLEQAEKENLIDFAKQNHGIIEQSNDV